MVNEKGKAIVSSSNPMEINGQKTVVACESKDAEETASKEVTNEENAILEKKNGKIAMEEQKNEETASGEEESNEGSKMEDDKKNDSNAEEDNEQNATAEVEDDEEAEEENDDQQEEIGEDKEENTVEQKEEKVGANSNDKVKISRKRSRKKNMEEEEEEEKDEENEENTNEQENNKAGANSVEKVKRPRKKTRRNKKTGKGSETLATKKVEDKPRSLGNKKESERAESMGMIFMCSSKTKKDCYHYNVLGLPASKREIVEKIYKGMRLFLFDFDLKLMYGIYKAAGPGGYNIEPEAFKSAFPSQVRFTVLEDCLPLAEEEFKTVIKENYYGKNKFDCQLNSTQVKDLCKLFAASSRGSKPKKLSRNGRAETRIGRAGTRIGRPEPRIVKGEAHTRVDRGRIRQRGRGIARRSALVADYRHRDARPSTYDREAYRQRNQDEERRSPLAGAHRHHDHPIVYERELAPLHHLPPLPPPTAGAPLYSGALSYAGAPSYGSYGRSLEIDAYGRDLVERRDPRLLDSDSRLAEIGNRDPYISYREVPSYRDTLYSSAALAQPEYYAPVEPRAEYRLAAPPPPEYRPPAAAPSDYDRLRPLYRY